MKLLSTIALMIALATPVAAQQPSFEACQKAGQIVGVVTDLRDEGKHPKAVYIALRQQGAPDRAAKGVIHFVYFQHDDKDKEQIVAEFLNNCLGESI